MKRLSRIWLIVGALAASVLLAAGCSGSSDAGPATTTLADCEADGTCAPGLDAAGAFGTPEGTYLGMPVGFTTDGFPYIGAPDAPVSIVEFSDYLCPFCQRHTTQTAPSLLLEYGISGDVNFVFRDFPLAGLHPTAPVGHAASLCVAEQGAVPFWQFHDQLFRTQSEWSGLSDPAEFLARAAEGVGVDMTDYRSCVAGGSTVDVVAARVTQGENFGFDGTPSFKFIENSSGTAYDLVGAQAVSVFRQYLDALLAGEPPPGAVPSAGLVSDGGASAPPPTVPTFTVDPDSQDTYRGLSVGFTAAGFPFIGSPDAPVSMIEFTDYLCPFCQRHTLQTTPALLDEYGASGEVNFVFRDFPLAGLHPTAPTGHAASVCVAEQGAAFFWAFHDSLFANQGQWAGLQDPGEYLAETAEQVGVDTAAYDDCIDSGRTALIVDARVGEGSAFGYTGTPSFQFVNNQTGEVFELVGAQPIGTFQSYLDAVLAGEAPPEAADSQDPPSQLPFWATEEGLVPDPDRPGFTRAGDPYKGSPDAPLVVVEFADFQCPACQQHSLEAQPLIDSTFVDTGQLMWVFKNLPLRVHPQATAAAAAAECAGDQGKFWEMHDLLFETVDEWATPDSDPVLADLGTRLGLDPARFTTCLAGREAIERVLVDLSEAEGVIAEVPSFVIIYDGQGRLLSGARTAEDFAAILAAQLESATSAPTP